MASISILMAVHNCETYLKECLASLIAQSFTDWELIVVDDGSVDGSLGILDGFDDSRIQVYSNQTNLGLTASLNLGLRNCKGSLIARMDADDIAAPDRLECQLARFKADEALVLLGSRIVYIDDCSVPIGFRSCPVGDAAVRAKLRELNATALVHPSIMFRAEQAKAIGGYDEDLPTAQDLDFYLRMMEMGKVDNLDEVLLAWRQHPLSTNSTHYHVWRERRRMILSKAKARGAKLDFVRLEKEIEVENIRFPLAAYRCASMAINCGRFKAASRHIKSYAKQVGFNVGVAKLALKYLVRRLGFRVVPVTLPASLLNQLKDEY